MADRTTVENKKAGQAQLAGKSLAQRVEQRHKNWTGSTERNNFELRVRDVIKYCRPDLRQYISGAPGKSRGAEIYTNKPQTDLEHASDAFCGNVFLQFGWFKFSTGVPELDADNETQKWSQRQEDHMYRTYADRGFYEVMPPLAMDAFSLGEGAMFLGLEDDGPSYEYCEMMATWFRRDRRGRITAMHRRHDFSAAEAYERWGLDCSDELVRCATGSDNDRRFSFIQAVYSATDPILHGITLPKTERGDDFVQIWIQERSRKNELPGDALQGVLGKLETYPEMPLISWPYWWKNNETYGRAALHLATVMRLQGFAKDTMLASQRLVAPPLVGSRSLADALDLSGDGVTWKDNPGDSLEPVYKGAIRYDFGVDLIQRTGEEIENMLHLPVFKAMTYMAQQNMRVDQVLEIIGEKAASLMGRLGLLDRLFLQRVHERTWAIEWRAGRIEPPPAKVAEYMERRQEQNAVQGRHESGMPLRVQYKGPLSYAQESLFLRRRVAMGLSGVRVLSEMGPEMATQVIDRINGDVAAEWILDQSGFLQAAIASNEDVNDRRAERRELERAQMNADLGKTQSEAARNLSQVAKETA